MTAGQIQNPTEAGFNSGFGAALLDPDIAIPDGITDAQGDVAPKRFGVYRNNVVVGLMEALKAAFPSILVILGEDNFSRVARNFIALHPPRSPMMQHYGGEFPQFVAGFAPLKNAGYLVDVARAERAFLAAWHAADAPLLDGNELAGIAPEQTIALSFRKHPATTIISSLFPVADLFAFRNGRPESGADLQKAQGIAFTRPGLEVIATTLTSGEAHFLSTLALGESLGEAAGAVLEEHPDFDISAAFATAINTGMFLPISTPNGDE